MKNKILVNLTPHNVVLITDAGEVTIPASGKIARVQQTLTESGSVNGIRLVKSCWGDIIDLPEEEKDTIYIVSAVVANAAAEKGRQQDIVCPADFVRNEQGQIIGAKALMFV